MPSAAPLDFLPLRLPSFPSLQALPWLALGTFSIPHNPVSNFFAARRVIAVLTAALTLTKFRPPPDDARSPASPADRIHVAPWRMWL
jgi:hypothetical protein